MQVAGIHMGGDQHFKVREFFFRKFHPYGVGHLRKQPIPLRKRLHEVIKLTPLCFVKAFLRGEEFDIGGLGHAVMTRH